MSKTIKKPELLAPAGDLEKLQTAVRFGADAVYVGAGQYSLRAAQSGFSLADLQTGIRFAHERGCKVYLALNIFPFDSDLEPMIDYLKQAIKYGIDAVIAADPGIIALINQLDSNIKIHLSTQANTTNSAAVKFWHNQNVSRIVLARELSLKQIQAIKNKIPEMELELFVHGAMCMSYSGRCLLSKHMTNRSANRGNCAQPCRWEYKMQEVQRDDVMTIEEDSRGTYILNSKDLCMIKHIPELIDSGLASFKIEGRMKPSYYVAAVTRIYRAAIDSYCDNPADYQFKKEWQEELEKVSHRPYTTGFYLPGADNDIEYISDSAYIKQYDFVGMTSSYNLEHQLLEVNARNKFSIGDTLEILDPHQTTIITLPVEKIINESGEYISSAHNQYTVLLSCPIKISNHSVIRRKK